MTRAAAGAPTPTALAGGIGAFDVDVGAAGTLGPIAFSRCADGRVGGVFSTGITGSVARGCRVNRASVTPTVETPLPAPDRGRSDRFPAVAGRATYFVRVPSRPSPSSGSLGRISGSPRLLVRRGAELRAAGRGRSSIFGPTSAPWQPTGLDVSGSTLVVGRERDRRGTHSSEVWAIPLRTGGCRLLVRTRRPVVRRPRGNPDRYDDLGPPTVAGSTVLVARWGRAPALRSGPLTARL